MLFEIPDFFSKPEGYSWQFEFEENIDSEYDEINFLSPITGKVSFLKTDFGLSSHFNVCIKVEMICDRCLEKFSQKIESEFDQNYIADYLKIDNEILKEEKDEGFIVARNGKLDIREAIRQGVFLNLPIKKVCSDSCKGINYKN